jgi:alpha-tubulin suppressor-like RCC1 family protein
MPNQFLSGEGDLENYFITEYWLIDQYVGDTLWTWGANASAQLGINNTSPRTTPVTTLAGGTNWKQVDGGAAHTAAIKIDGTLWTWGRNYIYGTLGDNTTTNKCTPVTTFLGGTNWKQVSCGALNTAAIKTDGTLWTWGWNSYGQLGINISGSNRVTPVTTFSGGTNWKQVDAGGNHIVAIKTDGTLWTWGRNNNGQLGVNDTINRSTPVQVFGNATNWKQVSCGNDHIGAIKTDGTLWTFGRNSVGQLGVNDTTNRLTPIPTSTGGTNWKQVSCGYNFTSAIKTDGTLWSWGWNAYGQLGVNDSGGTLNRTTPVTTFAGGTNWKQISCGYSHTSAIKTDGTLWVWGRNNNGQLGVNDTTQRNTPITAFTGGNNWKQVSSGFSYIVTVSSGTDPTYFIS